MRGLTRSFAPCAIFFAGILTTITPTAGVAQDAATDLSNVFDLGRLVADTNGDSVPDFVNGSLVLGANPSVAELAAAAEVSARLGFETMALDLPIEPGAP